jgi:hypothetical protein
MTIAVIWQEDGCQWCAADTRLVAGRDDALMTEIAAKMYAIPVAVSALNPGLRQPHYRTQYGFVYAGAALPASMTAVTASTFLQHLASPGEPTDPPTFEQIAELVCRIAKRFMEDRRTNMDDRRRFERDGLFSAAFFGWCPHTVTYKVAHIDGRNDAGGFRVELSYPPPQPDGEPWLVLGNAAPTFRSMLATYGIAEKHISKRVPRRVIDKMVAEGPDRTVGGATSIGMAHQHGFELCYAVEPVTRGEPAARRVFNGLDLDTEIGPIGQYIVAAIGVA